MPRQQTTTSPSGDRFAPLTDDDVRQQTDEGSFSRGRTYFRNGHIRQPILRGATIEAQCLGSEPIPYRVTATLAAAGEGMSPTTASCTCPRGGFCKHIVALLLTWIDDPGRFRELPPLAEQLAGRSPDQLIALIEQMVHRYPDLQPLVDLPPAPIPGEPANVAANAVIVDVSPLQRQIRSFLARYDPYGQGYGWYERDEWDSSEVPAEIEPIIDLMQRYADAGQWANAQAVATALAEEAIDVLTQFESANGEIGTVIIAADAMLASALDAQAELPEDQRLSTEQRRELLQTIYAIWQADIFEVGGFDLSQHGVDALIQHATTDERQMIEGWLREEQGDGWSKRSVVGFIADLREAGGDLEDDDLLTLYREAALWSDVALILLDMGRIDEAIATARTHTRAPHELTAFADALIRTGEEHASRAIGLVDDLLWEIEGKNAGQDEQLEGWLERQYAAHGREREALKLARRRFERTPNVHTYNEVERIARLPVQPDGTWDAVRPELLKQLESKNAWIPLIRIHLGAGEGAAALEAFDALERQHMPNSAFAPGWYAAEVALDVAAALEHDAPERAIGIYGRAAEGAIEMRNRQSYRQAAEHLARVKVILEREGRRDEWATYIADLREEHKRLRALREELDNRKLS